MQLFKICNAKPINFVAENGSKFDYIKVSILAKDKSGFGVVTQSVKLDKPSKDFDDIFGHCQSGKAYHALCDVQMESNGTNMTFIFKDLEFNGEFDELPV